MQALPPCCALDPVLLLRQYPHRASDKHTPFPHRSNRAMQRAIKATIAGLKGVLGIALALPLSIVAHAGTDDVAPTYGDAASLTGSDVPQRWRNYALASITPKFSWAPATQAVQPRVTDDPVDPLSFSSAIHPFGIRPDSSLNLSVAQSLVDGRAQALATPLLDIRSELPGVGLRRTVVAPSFVTRWGDNGTVGVTAVLAHQRFVSLGMGETAVRNGVMLWPIAPGESSYGAGMRLDVGNELTSRLSWGAAYQSRVNMDAFTTLRGVYSDPGQFDIPASTSLGLSYALTPSLSFDVGVQRVMYSEITPYTSPALPKRFLALLGTGASPLFAWQDLDVYSAGWTWSDQEFGNLELRYTTRQQPLPTSNLLKMALESQPADRTMAVGYSKATSRNSQLSLQAIYSSAPYFLGMPSDRATQRVTGDRVEYEAAWAWRF